MVLFTLGEDFAEMGPRLYLTQEEQVRLKKYLRKVNFLLSQDQESPMSFGIMRNYLAELIYLLSPASRTKQLVERLIRAMAHEAFDLKRRIEIKALLKELETFYPLDSVGFSPKQKTRKNSLQGAEVKPR